MLYDLQQVSLLFWAPRLQSRDNRFWTNYLVLLSSGSSETSQRSLKVSLPELEGHFNQIIKDVGEAKGKLEMVYI